MQIRENHTQQRCVVGTLKTSLRLFLSQFLIIQRAVGHPQVPWYAKLVAVCVIGYVCSPIQLIPNFIPIIGQLDDVLVVSLGIRLLRRWVPSCVLKNCS